MINRYAAKMNKAQYLLRKEEQRKNQELNQRNRRDQCLRCFRSSKNCFCSLIRPFSTEMHFVILMHPMEAKKERVGTGRLAHLCLTNSQLIVGVDFSSHPQVNQILADPHLLPVILYPGETSYNLSLAQGIQRPFPFKREELSTKKVVIFLLDGTWPCAKKMMKLSTNLQALPRIQFTPSRPSLFSIKHQPHPLCLSTIESIHCFIEEWNKHHNDHHKNQRHHHLLEVFQVMVDFQIKCALDPNLASYRRSFKGIKSPEQRIPAKKWEKRKLFFDG